MWLLTSSVGVGLMLARGNANQSNARPVQGSGPFPSPITEVTTAPGSSVGVSTSALPDGAATDASVLALQPVAVHFAHTNVTVSNTTAPALAANPAANYRLFQNIDATNAISLAFNVPAVNNLGIVLFPKERYEISLEAGNMDRSAVNCICAAGSPILLVTEG